ncbi:helix-turn-helix domain-containing protein [Xenorhabdus sp. KK7.4]|uniref:helix-turn-helix domain-containing protein n=1 Tax=Xenorhabdus sp. KK7.4 TaxID=1851572 RepID=UPI000C052134|nr:helix-turn-helix domain-containing protein [Xenorhabdus sp. KK7.4]PHM59963.1 hypothetical protein Xekk_00409 [Xenorhabdus sp. KK7.4]
MSTYVPARDYNDTDVVIDRIATVSDIIRKAFTSGQAHIDKRILGKSDVEFMFEVLASTTKAMAIEEITPEKKTLLRRLKSKLIFMETLKKDGGVLSSAETAKQLGVSKVTVKNWKDAGKLLALNIDGEFYFPVFQFTDNSKISNKGVLKGISQLLPLLKERGFSDRLQYSFFMEKCNTALNGVFPEGKEFSVAQLLQEGASDAVMQELYHLVHLYGSQDAA